MQEMTEAAEAWDEIQALYAQSGTRRYGLQSVSQLEHALQSAALAARQGEDDEMVVASLLHDIGHMVHRLGDAPAERGIDDRHEAIGAKRLVRQFGHGVSEPVRLHVAAKRHLCAVEPGYAALLSPDSVRSLALQGGAMDDEERASFEAEPFWREAVRLRRYDEAAKVAGLEVPGIEAYASRARRLLSQAGSATRGVP
jgi:phosphonate degradation associated HDIG domain protein